jgi:6-phosphogluconolactonase
MLKVQPTGGIMPRNFTITPSGKMLLVGHQKSDFITIFSRDVKTGLLTITNNTIPVSSAVCLKMIEIE